MSVAIQANRPLMDSGAPWLGRIPADWDLKRLKFLVSCVGGGTPTTGNPDFWGGEIPWVSPKDMKLAVITETEDYLTESGVRGSATSVIQRNAVLVVVRSGILRHSIPAARNLVPVALNQDMKALIPSGELKAAYLYWIIEGSQKQLLPLWSKAGCTVESIELDYMLGTELPLPSLDEQDAIARFLDHKTAQIDALIAKKQALLAKLAEKRSALISHAVTKGLDPSVPMKDSGVEWLESIPESWQLLPFRRLIIGGTQNGLYKSKEFFSKDGTPFVQMGEAFSEPVICRTAKDRVLLSNAELSQWGLKKGDLIFARRSLVFDGSGKCSVVGELQEPHVYESSMIRVRLNAKVLNSMFAFYFFGSAFGRAQMLATTKQVTISGIDSQQLKDILVCVPPIEDQVRILDYLQEAESQYTKAFEQIVAVTLRLQEYRSALITNAVTGKIDVRGFKLPEAAKEPAYA